MKLFTREWGTGPRTAVLVHGIMSDSRTWHRVAPRLATHGYRVLAVDLRGHGHSPRGAYNPHAWANDLVEKLPEHPELAIGHSLGAVALALAADRLRATRTVYSDPAWLTATADPVLDLSRLLDFKDATREQIAAMNPRWDARDVEVEAATLQLWDPATIDGARLIGVSHAEPDRPSASALVQLAFESLPFFPPRGAPRTGCASEDWRCGSSHAWGTASTATTSTPSSWAPPGRSRARASTTPTSRSPAARTGSSTGSPRPTRTPSSWSTPGPRC